MGLARKKKCAAYLAKIELSEEIGF